MFQFHDKFCLYLRILHYLSIFYQQTNSPPELNNFIFLFEELRTKAAILTRITLNKIAKTNLLCEFHVLHQKMIAFQLLFSQTKKMEKCAIFNFCLVLFFLSSIFCSFWCLSATFFSTICNSFLSLSTYFCFVIYLF